MSKHKVIGWDQIRARAKKREQSPVTLHRDPAEYRRRIRRLARVALYGVEVPK